MREMGGVYLYVERGRQGDSEMGDNEGERGRYCKQRDGEMDGYIQKQEMRERDWEKKNVDRDRR